MTAAAALIQSSKDKPMDKQYLSNLRNIKQSQPQPVEQTPQYQPTAEGDAWPQQSVYDLNFEEFFRTSSDSTNEFIRQTMAHHRALDEADAAAAAEAVFGPGVGGYGVVEESEPATETFADQF